MRVGIVTEAAVHWKIVSAPPGWAEGKGTRIARVLLTPAARKALAAHEGPLVVHMELLFSCMIRKRVLFPAAPHHEAVEVTTDEQKLSVWFRAVGTKACLVSEAPVPDLETFPIRKIDPFIPFWLRLDWRGGAWHGDFGYAERPG